MSSGVSEPTIYVRVPAMHVGAGAGTAKPTPPDLSQSPRLTIEQWASEETDHMATWGCVGGATDNWSQDATDVAQGKLAELVSGTIARSRAEPTPLHVTAAIHEGRERTLTADDAHVVANARTFVAFTQGRAHGCFVACTSTRTGSCDDVVASALLVGEMREPPPTGIVLGSLAFVIHRPHVALGMFGGVLLAAAVLAIVTRPRRRKHARGTAS